MIISLTIINLCKDTERNALPKTHVRHFYGLLHKMISTQNSPHMHVYYRVPIVDHNCENNVIEYTMLKDKHA